jgi:lysophospholipid acyltransferase (LPLAT)-like uncharacterized protein
MSSKLSFSHKIFINLIFLISKTWRIKVTGNFPKDGNGVIAFWHTFMLPCWKIFEKKGAYAVVSLSKDGEILSTLLEKMKFKLIRGSSSRNGKEVLDELVNFAEKGYLLITPDGPRGPIYEFKAGAAVTAYRTSKPLYLLGVKMHNYKSFPRAWDKFRFPLPFSKTEIFIDGPHFLNKELTREEVNIKIQEFQSKMRDLCDLS